MPVSPFDHPVLSGLLGDEEVLRQFSFEAELAAMLAFERALAEAEAEHDVIPATAAAAIGKALASFQPDIARLKAETARDGVVVPELVRQLRVAVGRQHGERVHFGATSQDVIDTALVLRLKQAAARLDLSLKEVAGLLGALEERFGGRMLTGITRMQSALPIRVSDRIASWRRPLERHRGRLAEQGERLFVVQFGGAVGTLDRLGERAGDVRRALAAKLGLADGPQWHVQRDALAEFAGWLSLVTASLGKFGQDVALMAAIGGEIELSGGGGSSAMPHKQNPVKAEALVALARFNAAQLSAVHGALVHEMERSGAAWTLEWLTLPQMAAATAGALRLAGELARQIESLGR
jgi:3-carboxy-cis,cis-muconate cycloisomerase